MKTIVDERVYAFSVDDTRLYWQTYLGGLHGCLQSDCVHTTINYGTPVEYSLGIGSNDVYWIPKDVSQGVIYTCPKTGCSGTPRTFLHDPNGVSYTFSADEDYFYWSSVFDIYRCPSAGCGATPEVVAANHISNGPLTFQGDNAYWLAPSTDNPGEAGAAGDSGDAGAAGARVPSGIPGLLSAPKDGSAPVHELRFRDAPAPSSGQSAGGASFGQSSFALSSTRVYWIDQFWRIVSCPLEGCTEGASVEVAEAVPCRSDLRVDEKGLYWTEPVPLVAGSCADGTLHFCAFAGCREGESAQVLDNPVYEYALSGPYVYFAQAAPDNGYPRNIQRMPKPTQ